MFNGHNIKDLLHNFKGGRTATPSILILACYILFEILQAQNRIVELLQLHGEKLNLLLDRMR